MKDVYIVWLTITNDMEPSHYSSNKERSIQGVYTSNELALAKIDDLYQQYAEASIDHPEWDCIHQECTIETYQVNP